MSNENSPRWPRRRASVQDHPLLHPYICYLKDVRGIRRTTRHAFVSRDFLEFLAGRGISLEAFRKREIDEYFIERSAKYAKKSLKELASCLRVFFRYLAAKGIREEDLSEFVESPICFTGPRDPRYLKSHQIAQVLGTPKLHLKVGLRDRAVLLLLALYGLRGSEIAEIRLEDIRWRAGLLAIRHRKCNDTLELPLLGAAADALAAYLKVRPVVGYREVFLTKFRPFRPIARGSASDIAKQAIRRAGISVPHPGARNFRCSHAQALFQTETPLPEIAAALGHKRMRTTMGYLQITVHPLREVALNDGEEMV